MKINWCQQDARVLVALCHVTMFVLLMQTEISTRLPVCSLTASLNDAYAEFYGTKSIIDSVWNSLEILAKHDFGPMNRNDFKNKYKPGTEQRTMSKICNKSVVNRTASDIKFETPRLKT